MRTLLALVLLGSILLLAGCPMGCGAYSGAGDRMFQKGTNTILLCENGGFVVHLTNIVEGRYSESTTDSVVALDGPTGTQAFTLTIDATNDTASSPELGGPWTEVQLDKTDLDHADVQCSDLTTRPWWNQ